LKNQLDLRKKLTGRPWYHHDNKYFHGKTFADNDIVMEFVKQTQVKILNGGDVSYITKSKWKGKITYQILSCVPFRTEADMIKYSIPNSNFRPEIPIHVKDNPMTLNKSLGDEIMEYLRTNFHQAIDFVPYLEPGRVRLDEDIFNLFQGFRYPFSEVKYETDVDDVGIPKPSEKIKKWIDHVIYVICSGDRKYAKTVLQWFAHIVQHPDRKAFAMIWRSEQGSGKSLFYDFFKKAIGEELTLQLSKIETMTEKHNKILEGRLIVNPNECSNYPTIKDVNILKSFVTEVELNINPKGRPCYTVNNYSRLLITTNEKFSMRLSFDDRRWFCLSVSSKKIGNNAYFKPLIDSVDDVEAQREFFNYLANYDLSDFHPQRPPMTAFKKSMIADQRDPVVRFVQDLCENCTDVEFKAETQVIVPNASAFYKVYYKRWCDDNGYRALTNDKFKSALEDTFGVENKKQRFDGKQARGYKFDRALLLPIFRRLYNDTAYEFEVCDQEE
jgi:hypothetical protein